MSVIDAVRRRTVDWPALLVGVLVCQLAGIVPSILTAGNVSTWYPTLAKPWFTPPGWVFGPVWTALYLLMGVALYLVWKADSGGRRGRIRRVALGLFGVQLLLNAGWTLVFFGSREIFAGAVVIVVLFAAILATTGAFARIDRRAPRAVSAVGRVRHRAQLRDLATQRLKSIESLRSDGRPKSHPESGWTDVNPELPGV